MSYYDGPIWNWFGLTRSSYSVLPRRALCSMPLEWQERFVKLMEEAEELLPREATHLDYWVRAKDGGQFISDPNIPYRHTGPWELRSSDPTSCADCGVDYVPGATHYSGCKSHPGELAVKP